MALTKCPNCGKQISDSAENCPHCGALMKLDIELSPEQLRLNRIIKWSCIVIGIVLFIVLMKVIQINN